MFVWAIQWYWVFQHAWSAILESSRWALATLKVFVHWAWRWLCLLLLPFTSRNSPSTASKENRNRSIGFQNLSPLTFLGHCWSLLNDLLFEVDLGSDLPHVGSTAASHTRINPTRSRDPREFQAIIVSKMRQVIHDCIRILVYVVCTCQFLFSWWGLFRQAWRNHTGIETRLAYDGCSIRTVLYSNLLTIASYIILDWTLDVGCDTPKILNMPSVVGFPIVGNLFQLGASQSLTYMRWKDIYGPVFQMRLGTKRVVVANSYKSAAHLWVDKMSSNNSRPLSYTFHKIVSSSQGLTIGTTPWSDTYRRKKRVAASALNKPAIQSYMSVVDQESAYCIDCMRVNLEDDLDVHPIFNTYALNTSLMLNYGLRLEKMDNLLDEIWRVEKEISRFRGNFHNYKDYLPPLRWIPGSDKLAVECRQRRDKYMAILLAGLKLNLRNAPSCITGNILRDKDAIISESELHSICLTMVSAGLDTVPSMLILFIGHMSQPYGQRIQRAAYEHICRAYPDGRAWTHCLKEDSVAYIHALVKETLRFSAMPISLPRENSTELTYDSQNIEESEIQPSKTIVIPKHTTLLLNAMAANFDPHRFHDPLEFYPERYLELGRKGPAHFAFGAGSRMCAGKNLAERELYTAVIRILSAFEIKPPKHADDLMQNDPFEIFKEHNSLMVEPPKFKVRLIPRPEFNRI